MRICLNCKNEVIDPPTHDKNGESVGGGCGYVFECPTCGLVLEGETSLDDSPNQLGTMKEG